MDLAERKVRLKRWQDAYFNLDPEVSDQEYDAERDAIAAIEPGAPEVMAVGAPPPKHSVWEKVEHEIVMGSLRKANSLDEMLEWTKKCLEAKASYFYITQKLDGSSMELVYAKGKLIRCVTRGDGTVGEDVTENISQVPNVPREAKWDVDFTVRGEVLMEKAVFQEHYAAEYANPRNTAAAIVRKKKGGGVECKHLRFLAHGAVFNDEADRPDTMNKLMARLEGLGFEVPPGTAHPTIDEVLGVFDSVKNARDALPYEIDGMVVTVNSLKVLDAMGEVAMRPLGQIAWKFDAVMAETRMVDVKWQVGHSGRVTPVAVVEPVNIGGVVVTNVSLHNMTMFRELKLFAGCRVLISRRNDVIPYIEKNLDLPNAA
jgi:DNA ligase (NAD+)